MRKLQRIIRCLCKVNVYLKIKERREDGYHTIESIFLPLSNPWDEMIISPGEEGLEIMCNLSSLEKKNILYKIYEEFSRHTGFKPPLKIILTKHIPLGAGLGGASSNAAELLKYLVELGRREDIVLSPSKVMEIAKSCGADVPFFMAPYPSYVEGIGEKIRPINISFPYKNISLLVVCPPIHISTKWAYEKWDKMAKDKETLALTNGIFDINKPFRFWANDFESVVFEEYPQLHRIKIRLLQKGARACVMSGSGASLIALYSGQIQNEVLEELNAEGITFFVNTGV